MVPSFITAIKLLLFLSESILPSPLQQDGISFSEIRPESGRSIHAPHGVIITQSYSKIRRQGRKGDPDPFAINALQSKLDDDLSKENSIPVSNDFGNDGNSLPTPTTTYNPEEIIPTTIGQDLVSSNIKEYYDYDYDYSNSRANQEKFTVIFVKSSKHNQIPNSDLESGLKNLIGDKLKVFLNEIPAVVQNELNVHDNVLFADVNIAEDNKISGNVFSNSRPLEELEGEDYEEALQVLNKISTLLENIVQVQISNQTEPKRRKIILIINTFPSGGAQKYLDPKFQTELYEALKSPETEISIHLDEKQEVVLQQEYNADLVPIVVTNVIDTDHKTTSGNIYYNSQPLEKIANVEKYDEAFRILTTVNNILESNLIMDEYEYSLDESVESVLESKKILVSLFGNNAPVLQSDILAETISEQLGIETSTLLSPSKFEIDEMLRGFTVPILVNVNLNEANEINAYILYKFIALENLNLPDYDEAVKILSLVKQTVRNEVDLKTIHEEDFITGNSDSDYFLPDNLIESDVDEGSAFDFYSNTEEPSDSIDFGYIEEVAKF